MLKSLMLKAKVGCTQWAWMSRNFTTKMARRLTVDGYEAVKKVIQEGKGVIYVLFSGSVDESGKNWCPDCEKADPVVERNVDKLSEDVLFVHCHVGQRDYWKDANNDFRKDPQFKLKCVPTLLKIGTPKRLEEEQCANDSMLEMMFEED